MLKRSHRHRDESARRAHREHISRSQAPKPGRLDDRREAAHQQRPECRPGQVRLGTARAANHDRDGQYDAPEGEDGVLERQARRQRPGRPLVGLVADGGCGRACYVTPLAIRGRYPGQFGVIRALRAHSGQSVARLLRPLLPRPHGEREPVFPGREAAHRVRSERAGRAVGPVEVDDRPAIVIRERDMHVSAQLVGVGECRGVPQHDQVVTARLRREGDQPVLAAFSLEDQLAGRDICDRAASHVGHGDVAGLGVGIESRRQPPLVADREIGRKDEVGGARRVRVPGAEPQAVRPPFGVDAHAQRPQGQVGGVLGPVVRDSDRPIDRAAAPEADAGAVFWNQADPDGPLIAGRVRGRGSGRGLEVERSSERRRIFGGKHDGQVRIGAEAILALVKLPQSGPADDASVRICEAIAPPFAPFLMLGGEEFRGDGRRLPGTVPGAGGGEDHHEPVDTFPGRSRRLGYDENIGRIRGFAGENRTTLQQSARLLMICARDQQPVLRTSLEGADPKWQSHVCFTSIDVMHQRPVRHAIGNR